MSKKVTVLSLVGIVVIIAIAGIVLSIGSSGPNKGKASTLAVNSQDKHTPNINNSVVVTKNAANVGTYLADPSGYALYTYSSDKPGVSYCTGSCLSIWPAYQDTGKTTGLPINIGTIKRKDNGEIQYTYKGMPLYTFASDKPGEVNGNGIAGFKVARP
jgi:predicted lipoprotein with Yx(FWY)xxD motif